MVTECRINLSFVCPNYKILFCLHVTLKISQAVTVGEIVQVRKTKNNKIQHIHKIYKCFTCCVYQNVQKTTSKQWPASKARKKVCHWSDCFTMKTVDLVVYILY